MISIVCWFQLEKAFLLVTNVLQGGLLVKPLNSAYVNYLKDSRSYDETKDEK